MNKKVKYALIFCCLLLAGFKLQAHEISLKAELKTGFLGIPDGMKKSGYEAYVDFSNESILYKSYGEQPPLSWDVVFTYALKDISMGPMGVHKVPFFMIKSNEKEGIRFYSADNNSLTVTEYEFIVDRKFNYTLPEIPFIFKSDATSYTELKLEKLVGITDEKTLFSATFSYNTSNN